VAKWEKELIGKGYQKRTAGEARSLLGNILNDAIPRYIQVNPAARKRGKGKRGQRRIEAAEKAEKVWPTPLQALLFAERCAVLTGDNSDFVLNITIAYTGCGGVRYWGLGRNSSPGISSTFSGSCTNSTAGSTGAARRTVPSGPLTSRRFSRRCWNGRLTRTRGGSARAATTMPHGAREWNTSS
jgi:hypothetical protein